MLAMLATILVSANAEISSRQYFPSNIYLSMDLSKFHPHSAVNVRYLPTYESSSYYRHHLTGLTGDTDLEMITLNAVLPTIKIHCTA